MKNKIYLLSASLMVATFSFFSCVSSGEKKTGKDEIEKKVENLLTRVRDKDCVKNRVKRAKIVRFTLC